jgi:hypothetical protein
LCKKIKLPKSIIYYENIKKVMTRTKFISSILVVTMLLATFATTSITMQAFAQQSPNPNGQGQQFIQQQSQAVQQQQQQVTQGSPYLQQQSIQSVLQQEQRQSNPVNQEATSNPNQQGAQVASGTLLAVQAQNVNVGPVQVAVPIDIDANVCGVSVIAEADPVTCRTR